MLSPLPFIVYIRVLHTTTREPNPIYEVISPCCKTHFANNEKIIQYIYENCVNLAECKISRKKAHYARFLAFELLCNSLCSLSQKLWRALVYMNWIDSHRRVDKDVTAGNCMMNRLFCAGKLVLYAWIFSTGSSARIWPVFCCVRPRRNENQLWKDWDIMSRLRQCFLGRRPRQCFLQVSGNTLQQVETFKYRGVVFTSGESRKKGIDIRIGKAIAVLRELYYSMVTKRGLSKNAKLSVFKSVFVPIFICSHES